MKQPEYIYRVKKRKVVKWLALMFLLKAISWPIEGLTLR